MEWRTRERIPLSKGASIELSGSIIVNDDLPEKVDKGGTCLVYRGHVKSGHGIIPGTKVIIKEFYPQSDTTVFDIVREQDKEGLYSKLSVRGITKDKEEYKSKFEQFMQGIEIQKELARSTAMEVAIKPWLEGQFGDSYYVVSEIHNGCDIVKYGAKTLTDKLEVAVCVAESMSILHESGYIMLDFKPENLMYIQKPNMVRIIDTDSIMSYRKDEGKYCYGNRKYASPELRKYFIDIIEKGKRRRILKPISDIYALGVFYLEMFWNWLPENSEENALYKETLEETLERMDQSGELLEKFIERYKKNSNVSSKKLKDVGKRLIAIIKRTTYFNRNRRKTEGFNSALKLMKELNEVYYILTSELLVPRKEIAKANASFAAYNMLQKYPLFEYPADENCLCVTLAGKHMMLEDMVSAVISIGQMLDKKLEIHLTGKNIEGFWEYYTCAEKNAALKSAVVVFKDDQVVLDNIDERLVDRPLAKIVLHTEKTEKVIKELVKAGAGNYFVLLEEEEEVNKSYLDVISKNANGKKMFVGYLQQHEEDNYEDASYTGLDVYGISALSFSETYNEKMFEERIFRMGMMAHAYYKGYMKEDCFVEMDELESEFRQDVYNIESSERCALHSIYKMASLGIDKDKPGRVLNYYRKIQEPDVLEKLAALEHLSWTGYMLTSGAGPVCLDEFGSYAYKRENDWKCKDDKKHLRHPLLVASRYIDEVSQYIQKWYIEQKEPLKIQFEQFMEKQKGQEEILRLGRNLIEGAEPTNVEQWKAALADLEKAGEKEMADTLKRMMKPAVDSYRDCDFKRLDRELVFSAVDMMI